MKFPPRERPQVAQARPPAGDTGQEGDSPLPRLKPVPAKHLEGVNDIFVSAPIKEGFIDSFEHVTFETRLRITMDVLFKMRSISREYNLLKPFVDSAERIQAIRSFRLGIEEVESELAIRKHLVLAATFDRAWDPYIRLIWNPLGAMLDVLFCNCDHYVTAVDHSFEEYNDWVRRSRIDTGFFYATTNLSVADLQYHVELERLHREGQGEKVDRRSTLLQAPDPVKAAEKIRRSQPDASTEIGLEALGALYRLTSYYPSDRPSEEGKYLHRAARSLLHGWNSHGLRPRVRETFREWLDWYENKQNSAGSVPPAASSARPAASAQTFDPTNVQAGIVSGYAADEEGHSVSHGCLLLMSVTDAASARAFLSYLKDQVTSEAHGFPADGIFRNLAFTFGGLRRLELSEEELRSFPPEFAEGPEARAGLLGDVLRNHPRRWRLPARNWPEGPGAADRPRVHLSEVDLAVQLRTYNRREGHDLFDAEGRLDTDHPLAEQVKDLAARAECSGVRLLSIQPMHSKPVPAPDGSPSNFSEEHFGFADGFSQPSADRSAWKGDRVRLGEILLGYPNDRSDPGKSEPCLKDGSFLVVRRIRQHVHALEEWAERQSNAIGVSKDDLLARMMGRDRAGKPLVPFAATADLNRFNYQADREGKACPLQSHIRRANPRTAEHGRRPPRIMRRGMSFGPRYVASEEGAHEAERGIIFMSYQASIAEQYEVVQRWLNGGNSTGIASSQNDPLTGVGRPGDPRTFRWNDGGKVRRVKLDQGNGNAFVDLDWLLYLFVPSLATIDHLSKLKRMPDPVERRLGIALIDRLQKAERMLSVRARLAPALRPGSSPLGEREPDQRLSASLFLKVLIGAAREFLLEKIRGGDRDLDSLRDVAAKWKAIFEDFGARDPAERSYGPCVWAAIRENYGGVLRVPYGDLGAIERLGQPEGRRSVEKLKGHPTIERVALVASEKLVSRVLRNADGLYSVAGQHHRMNESFGPIYIGLDESRQYHRESDITNAILMSVGKKTAFDVAHSCAAKVLEDCYRNAEALLKETNRTAPIPRSIKLDVSGRFITPALARICAHWFGIPNGAYFEAGTSRRTEFQEDGKSRCPGDFIAPSRYLFYPDPSPAVCEYGSRLGKRLRRNVDGSVSELRQMLSDPNLARGGLPPIAVGMAEKIDDDELLGRNLIGILTGMIPPMDGCLRGALHGWLREMELWRVQQALLASNASTAFDRAEDALEGPLRTAIQRRPAPDLLWRRATRDHRLGRVRIRKGDKLVLGIVSATMEKRDRGENEVYAVFGGDRKQPDHPLHACPAYDMAMGTMLGILSALLEKGTIKSLPPPLMIELVEGTPTA